MQTGRRVRVVAGSSRPAADPNSGLFTATLAQNVGLNGRVKLPEAIAAGRTAQCIVQGIQITSQDQLDWELWFWANSKFQVVGLDATAEAFRGYWGFATGAGDGKRIGGTGLYYYYIDGLGIFYEDDDAATATPPLANTPDPTWRAASNGQAGAFLNVTLVNRSAGAKTASAWFDVTFILEPTQGQ